MIARTYIGSPAVSMLNLKNQEGIKLLSTSLCHLSIHKVENRLSLLNQHGVLGTHSPLNIG
jgi:hypothetical protein